MNHTNRFAMPDMAHPLGTDQFGRDVLSRIMVASRAALLVGLCSVTIGTAAGMVIGAAAAMSGRVARSVLICIVDGMMAFPGILIASMLVAILGKGLLSAVMAIGVFMVPSYSKLVYSIVLDNRQKLHIKAAQSYGSNPLRIVFFHIFPDMLPRLITQFSASVGGAIMLESSLSFLGLGIQPPSPSWGMMLREASQFILNYPFLSIPPGAILLIAVLGFNLLGDGLNDAWIGRSSNR